MNDMLILERLKKSYNRDKPNEIAVLKGADLAIPKGQLVALVAPSGAGKSTLLHIAGLLDTPDSGRVVLDGADLGKARDDQRTAARRGQIGFVYQFHHLLPEFSAAENIVLPQLANGANRSDAEARAAALLGRVGLAARVDHRPSALSGGEQQRVAFCRALANAPGLILADEPTGNLDPATAEAVFGVLIGLVRDTGLSALIATHNLELAVRMDRVLRLENGTLTEE